jgi:hypothetical protein
MEYGNYEFLLNKDVNFIRSAYPNPTSTGIPKYYAIFGPTTTNTVPAVITNEYSFLLGPTPDAAYDIELHYYYYPESIVTASTTWLADNFDMILLYGSLLEAYTFMKGEPDVINNYEKRYNEALCLPSALVMAWSVRMLTDPGSLGWMSNNGIHGKLHLQLVQVWPD